MSVKTAAGVTIVTSSSTDKTSTGSGSTKKSNRSGTPLMSVSTRLSTAIEDEATNEQLHRLGSIFEEADEDGEGGLDIDAFRKAMRMTMGDHVTDEDLDMMFMKVDTNCDGTVDWEEYLTFMLLECRERDLMTTMELKPFPRVARFITSEHRDSIVRIVLVPYMISSQIAAVMNNSKGRYVACGKDGTVTFWSMSMEHKTSQKVMPASSLHTSVWVTDMACLPRFHFLVFATTARDIQFYDTNANRFERLSRVTGLNACPTALSFHESRWSIAKLMWGDQDGGVSAIAFHNSPMLTALNPKRAIGGKDVVPFSEILAQNVESLEGYYIPGIHRDCVKQLMFSEHLNCVVSISRISETAMFIGDLEQKLTNSYFRVSRGINTFDYSNRLNLIVTGGQDALVRVWNPYVTKKPVSILRGHQSPVTQVHLNDSREQVISIAENKDIRVHDINSHVCVQTFFRKMIPDVGFRSITASILNEYRQALVFATSRLMLLEHRDEDLRHLQIVSHTKPVTAAIYNPLFKQVVSAAADSTVTVWTMVSGHKVMQFRVQTTTIQSEGEADYIEVTAMCFDPTYRRLITATRLGLVCVWNFNNGACLHEFPTFDYSQITAIICARSRIICGGWNRRVTIYFDNDDDPRNVVWLKPDQADDILDMAFYPPQTLATSSYEGRIYIWSLNTQNLLYALETKQRHNAEGNMFDYKRRTSEVVRANRESRREKNNRKLTTVALMIDAATAAGPTPEIRLPKISSAMRVPTDDVEADKRKKSTPPPTPSPTPPPSRSASSTRQSTACSVEKLLFLTKRENSARTATLLSACGDGSIRAWSVHHHGGYLGAWIGVHHVGDMVTAMVPCPENNLLFTGDSSGYIKVWDISHYLIRCRSCSDEEHAERQDVWDRFPMMKWLRHLEEICMLHLDFRCMKTAHERDTPHLLNSFRGHVRVINSIDHFQNKHGSFLLTAGGDCSVRLWTLDGLFMGIFGQSRLWELSSVPTQVPPRRHRTDKYHRPRGYLLPPDVRKCGSSTTLHVMNAFTPNRWIRIVNLVRGVNAFKSILRRSSSERVAKEKQIQAILDIPVAEETKYKRMVVESIAPKARVRNDPPKPRIPYYRLQCPAYRTFPLQEITDIDFPGISTMLKGVRDRYGFSHRDQVHMRFARIARQMTKPSGSVLGRQDGEDGTGRKNTAMGRFAIIAKATVKKERSTDTNDGT